MPSHQSYGAMFIIQCPCGSNTKPIWIVLKAARNVLRRHNVNVRCCGQRTIMFAQGFGFDQTMWQPVARDFEKDFRVSFSTVSDTASRFSYADERYMQAEF